MDLKIAKNYLYNIAYQILVIITPLITAPYISRVLHTDGVGLYSYTSTIAAAFALFSGLGFSAYGQREIAYNQDNKHKRSLIFFEIVILRAILTIVVSAIYVYFCMTSTQYTVYLLPQILIVLAPMLDMSFYFQGIENFKIVVIRNVIIRILTVVSVFAFVRTSQDVVVYISIHAISMFICNLIYCGVISNYIEKVKLQEINILRHFRGAIEFCLP